MSEYLKLESELYRKVEQLRSTCPHEETKEYGKIGDVTVYQCNRCGKIRGILSVSDMLKHVEDVLVRRDK